jgi:hypothetical protein
MKAKETTPEGLKELQTMSGPAIFWTRREPLLERYMAIYLETLTADQRDRVNAIELELLDMAHSAKEEVRTILRGK